MDKHTDLTESKDFLIDERNLRKRCRVKTCQKKKIHSVPNSAHFRRALDGPFLEGRTKELSVHMGGAKGDRERKIFRTFLENLSAESNSSAEVDSDSASGSASPEKGGQSDSAVSSSSSSENSSILEVLVEVLQLADYTLSHSLMQVEHCTPPT